MTKPAQSVEEHAAGMLCLGDALTALAVPAQAGAAAVFLKGA
ncbi:hypothetical protein [Paraburkholderia sp.]|nr:hypothetical protein [Paraburkholderia sp.]